MENFIYIVYVTEVYGYYSSSTYKQFATADITTAEIWCTKYNRIVDNNRERLLKFYKKDWLEFEGEHYWTEHICQNNPTAHFSKIRVR